MSKIKTNTKRESASAHTLAIYICRMLLLISIRVAFERTSEMDTLKIRERQDDDGFLRSDFVRDAVALCCLHRRWLAFPPVVGVCFRGLYLLLLLYAVKNAENNSTMCDACLIYVIDHTHFVCVHLHTNKMTVLVRSQKKRSQMNVSGVVLYAREKEQPAVRVYSLSLYALLHIG